MMESQKVLNAQKTSCNYVRKNFFSLMSWAFKVLIPRAGWNVTKRYLNFDFEQEMFKRNFILTNQRSSKNAKQSVEIDFLKLRNNANVGYDCYNNFNNCTFEPICDETSQISYIQKYYKLFQKLLIIIIKD